jgi:hypothetical protein
MKLTLVLAMFVLSITLYGQNGSSNQAEKKIESIKIDLSEACNKDKTSWTVQDLPEYVGGNKKLIGDLNHLLTIDKDLTGKCYVSFLINCEGEASGFVITEGNTNNDLNKKIIESLVKLQNWKPGKYKNEDVDCTYTLRLVFKDGYLMLEN